MFIPVEVWLRAFALTLLVELPIAGIMLRRFEPSVGRRGLLIVFANLATHPAVWFVFTQWFLIATPTYVLAAEGWAVGAEALFYWTVVRGLPPRWALVVSLVANAASFIGGRLLIALVPDFAW